MTELTVVVPMHDEVRVVRELAARVCAACATVTEAFELVVANDASGDGTGPTLDALAADEPRIRPLHLASQHGQLGATRAGLCAARGATVVVLDGDLQDPPELIPALLASLARAQATADVAERPADDLVAFAVKARGVGPMWFRAGRIAYHAAQRVLGRRIPSGAGSYAAMSAQMAHRAARVRVRDANLAAVLVALGARAVTVPYAKADRYDDRSRVGPLGLVKEAVGSLRLLSPWGTSALASRPSRAQSGEDGDAYREDDDEDDDA